MGFGVVTLPNVDDFKTTPTVPRALFPRPGDEVETALNGYYTILLEEKVYGVLSKLLKVESQS